MTVASMSDSIQSRDWTMELQHDLILYVKEEEVLCIYLFSRDSIY